MRFTILAAALVAAVAAGTFHARAAAPGLTCMEPTILDSNPNPAFTALPRVFASPAPGSKQIGVATSVVYALSPSKRQNGFLEVLHPNGMYGWVRESAIEPWHNVNNPSARCSAHVLPNGKPHARY